MRLQFRNFVLIALVTIAAIAVIVLEYVPKPGSLNSEHWFSQQNLSITSDLYDLGVADVNNDNWLDIYTTNHSARQQLLVNTEVAKFSDQLLPLGLTQNTKFPGVEPSDLEPEIKDPGLYIYWHQAKLIVRTHGMKSLKPIRGQIQFACQSCKSSPAATSISTSQYNINLTKNNIGKSLNLEFSSYQDGQVTISFREFIGTPLFKLSEQLPLDQIYIGSERISPNSSDFKVSQGKDRHGMAWADYDGDEKTDVFIVRGGGAGRTTQNSSADQDELLIQKQTRFINKFENSSIEKNTCPARQVAPIDFDNDGLLDLYVVCGREGGSRQLVPNQLHWHQADGSFINVAHDKGIDIPEIGSFIWLDSDQDNDMDLIWADQKNNNFWLYINQFGNFNAKLIGKSQGKVNQMSVADYDSDGDLDIFATSTTENTLLDNNEGIFRSIKPSSVGLPLQSVSANWVDYDNDGLMDLYTWPNGLYRRHPDQMFEMTHLLESRSEDLSSKVFSSWFDSDNNGSRDLLIAIEENASGQFSSKLKRLGERLLFQKDNFLNFPFSEVQLYRNNGMKNHWLEVQLVGPQGNHEAIGAHVEVHTPQGIQRHQVGQAEGAIRSQGHYRLYFGLGNAKQPQRVKVFWPDGHQQDFIQPEGDRLLIVKHNLDI